MTSAPIVADGAIPPKSGIKVILVGAGFGGLTTAIECHRQGHSVEVYESFPELKSLGDIISFGNNGGRIFHRWDNGSVSAAMRSVSIDLRSYGFKIHKYDTGEVVRHQPSAPRNESAPAFNGHRGELHEIVFRYAEKLGIKIHLGRRVVRYFEDDNGAGVEFEVRGVEGKADGKKDGEKEVVRADVVVGSDGVRSKARTLVLGYEDKPKSSGYAVWRAWYSNKDMLLDPLTAPFELKRAERKRKHFVLYMKGYVTRLTALFRLLFPHKSFNFSYANFLECTNGDTFNGWIGPDVHFLFSTIKNGSDCCWVLTHRDDHDIDESWSFPGKLEDVLKVLEGWDPMCKRIVEKTPSIVDWKLVYRDPLPTWVSKGGRICLLGDAAHPFLPTSAQGATQALEDGVTLAICLKRAGKDNVPLAVRAYQEIRYDRVKAVQKMGETTRDMWHKADWDKVKKDPKSIELPREDWVLQFDAERHAEDVFDEIVRNLA